MFGKVYPGNVWDPVNERKGERVAIKLIENEDK